MEATIISKPHCKYCSLAKKLLKKREINISEKVLGQDISREELLKILPNVRTVPQIWLDDVYIGGYDDFLRVSDQYPTQEELNEYVENYEFNGVLEETSTSSSPDCNCSGS